MLTDATFSVGRAADLLFPDGSLSGGPVVVIPRRIVGGVGAALDGLAPAALPRLRFEAVSQISGRSSGGPWRAAPAAALAVELARR